MSKRTNPVRPHSRLDVKSGFHRKVLFVGNAAWGAFQRLVAISNDYGTDGWVDVTTVSTVCSDSELAALLAPFPWAEHNSPLLEGDGKGYLIHDFLVWNDSAEYVRNKREEKAKRGIEACERMNRARANKMRTDGERSHPYEIVEVSNTGVGVKILDLSPEGEPEREPTKASKLELREAQYRKAYIAGVQRGKGAPFVFPSTPWAQGDLNSLLVAAGGLRDDLLLKWIEDTAFRFARWLSTHPDRTDFYSSYLPKGCAKFINDQSRVPVARTMSEVRPVRGAQDEAPVTQEQHAAFVAKLAEAVGKVGT